MEWLLAKDQEKFGKKLNKQMLNEINRFMSGKKTIETLIEETFPQIIHKIEMP